MDKFQLVSPYSPTGDQPQAIAALTEGVLRGDREQTLRGITGSGKTFTMANVIANTGRPTLVLAHNKTLAAQLCSELREFFPHNAVEYFVSYYDYFRPEAYVAQTDTYIEKTSEVNDEIDKLRHSATSSLFERRDVIVVSSVSCIYSLGDPQEYRTQVISLRPGMRKDREEVIRLLVAGRYERNDMDFQRNRFRVRGDVLEVFPSNSSERAVRVEFFGDEIERLTEIDVVANRVTGTLAHAAIYPATHYVAASGTMEEALAELEEELRQREAWFTRHGKLIEAQRIGERTRNDMEMLREVGYCNGVENYSRVLSRRPAGSTPYTLMDYFPKDFLLIVDESHVTLPQVRGMYRGDRARKETLVEYGFRLPSALDNRPLRFEEFEERVNQAIYVSATPAPFEIGRSTHVVEQILRPTGLLDPLVEVRPTEGQIDDLIGEIRKRTEVGQRVLVTTLTKNMAEELTLFLEKFGVAVKYIHHDVESMERMELLRDLRLGVYHVLVGINLLREGLDLPEVSLVAILDADKEGFLRSETSLIQTIGRAARNAEGTVIMYADRITDSMQAAITETARRRKLQQAYNEAHGITPASVVKEVRSVLEITSKADKKEKASAGKVALARGESVEQLEKEMKAAAASLDFELAAYLRDRIRALKQQKQQ